MTTTRTPRPLTGPALLHRVPGTCQVPVGPSGDTGQEAIVWVELVSSQSITPTSTLLPTSALGPGRTQSVLLSSVPHTTPPGHAATASTASAASTAGGAMQVAA